MLARDGAVESERHSENVVECLHRSGCGSVVTALSDDGRMKISVTRVPESGDQHISTLTDLFNRRDRFDDRLDSSHGFVTASRNGLTIVEVPVVMRQRQSGHSSINRRKSAYYMLKVSLAMCVEAMRKKITWKEV